MACSASNAVAPAWLLLASHACAVCLARAVTVPAERLAWYALSAALCSWTAGDLYYTFARLVPRGDAGESFLRASLLPLAGDGRAGEGVAGQLGAVAVQVVSAGDGWPDRLDDAPLSRLTPGQVDPRAS